MPEANVGIVRQVYDSFNRWAADPHRRTSLDSSLLHPEVEFHTYETSPEAGIYRGPEAVIEYNQRLFEQFESVRIEVAEVVPAGDRVLVTSRQHAVPKGGQMAMVVEVVEVWTVRDGLLAVRQSFSSRAEALEAVGLRGRGLSQDEVDIRALAEAAFEALNSGDLDAFLALIHEQVEFTSFVAEAEGTTFRGHDGVRAWWDTVRGAFDQPRWEVLDLRGSTDSGVARFRLEGTLGGARVAQEMWQAGRVRDGKLGWWAFFRTEHEAVAAVELRE